MSRPGGAGEKKQVASKDNKRFEILSFSPVRDYAVLIAENQDDFLFRFFFSFFSSGLLKRRRRRPFFGSSPWLHVPLVKFLLSSDVHSHFDYKRKSYEKINDTIEMSSSGTSCQS